MEFQIMTVKLNKDKSIGKVLYIVEGNHTEPFLLSKIFNKILDYQYETVLRGSTYHKYNSKINPTSQVFVINTESSNIKSIDKNNNFLNNLFAELITNYNFDVDNSAIYYIFDRDCKSNTDSNFILNSLKLLKNSRENDNFLRQGLLLLNYPSIESFTLSNFKNDSFLCKIDTGDNLKAKLESDKINQSHISEETLLAATNEMLNAFSTMNIQNFDIDNFGDTNLKIFDHEETLYLKEQVYQALSLLSISLLDLGIIEIID